MSQTPLHLAVLTEQPLVVKKLLMLGAKVDIGDRHGNTPLHLASIKGYMYCAQELLTCHLGASVHVCQGMNYEGKYKIYKQK